MIKRLGIAILLASACLWAAEPVTRAAVEPEKMTDGHAGTRSERLWKLSLAGLAAANAADIGSSWGKRELNGALRSADGSFGARGAALKLSFQGALVGSELLLLRNDRRASRRRMAAWINVAAGAVIAGVAIHNSRIARPSGTY
jgi:hypothetical protein